MIWTIKPGSARFRFPTLSTQIRLCVFLFTVDPFPPLALCFFVISCLLILRQYLVTKSITAGAVLLVRCQTKANTQSAKLAESGVENRKFQVNSNCGLLVSAPLNVFISVLMAFRFKGGKKITKLCTIYCKSRRGMLYLHRASPLLISNPPLAFFNPRHSEISNSDLLACVFVRFFQLGLLCKSGLPRLK